MARTGGARAASTRAVTAAVHIVIAAATTPATHSTRASHGIHTRTSAIATWAEPAVQASAVTVRGGSTSAVSRATIQRQPTCDVRSRAKRAVCQRTAGTIGLVNGRCSVRKSETCNTVVEFAGCTGVPTVAVAEPVVLIANAVTCTSAVAHHIDRINCAGWYA